MTRIFSATSGESMHSEFRRSLRDSARRGVVPALLVISGAAGLGYQIVWIRLLSIGLGHEAIAMLSVVCAFLAGLAIGAAVLDRLAAHTECPGLWYAGLEVLIGAWALVLWAIMPWAGDLMIRLTGPDPSALRQIAVAGGVPFLLLAPATIPIGATLPFAERLHVGLKGGRRAVGALYAANVFGAAIGAGATLALLGPRIGFGAILPVLAVGNLVCALVALALWRQGRAAPPKGHVGNPASGAPFALLFATGLLGIGFEVVVARGAAQTLENTVYSYATILCLYLAGAGAGSAMRGRMRCSDGPLLGLLAAAVLAGTALLPSAPDVYMALTAVGLPGNLAEAAVIALVFLPASVLMGALFASMAQAAHGPGGGLGLALAVNLTGGAAAPLIVGTWLIPLAGTVYAGAILAFGYALLAMTCLSGKQRIAVVGVAVCGSAAFGATIPAALVKPAPGEHVLRHTEAAFATATTLRDGDGQDRLVVDGRFGMGGDRTENVDRLQGHLPLLLHPDPHRALFLGLGSGATAAAAARHPGLKATAVELARPVIDALPAFAGPAQDIAEAGITLRLGDARRFVRAADSRWDVIVADTFHPARDGAALLYTVEHFAAIRARLEDGGLFAQWIPLHQFDLPMLRTLTRSFLDVFPDARLFMANASLETPLLALVGTTGGAVLPYPEDLTERVQTRALADELAALGLDGALSLVGGQLAGPRALSLFAGDAKPNTDAFPRLLFEAPASVYTSLGPASDRLLTLLDLARDPEEAIATRPSRLDAEFTRRLAAYWTARDRFIRLGAKAALTGRPRDDATAIGPALLDISAGSPEYTPARRPILALAAALVRDDPAMARDLLRAAEDATGHADFRNALAAMGG